MVEPSGWAEPPRFVLPADPRPADPPWPSMRWPPGPEVALTGATVVVRPVDPVRDAPRLFAALDDDRVWAHLTGRPHDAHEWELELTRRAAAGWQSWVVELRRDGFGRAVGSVVGTSSYLEVAVADARLEIGSTAYAPDVWASRVNPETKLLLLQYAFDTLGAGRVQLKTDIRNHRSAQAIARLGASFEGVLRRYQRRADGSVRDTLLFSILAEQWPAVRERLEARLSAGEEQQ